MTRHARLQPTPIPFIDLAAQRRALGPRVDAAVARVMEHCQFILGPEVQSLEAELAGFCGARHAVTCASGTDALALVLMARGVGPGDAVICPSFAFCAPAEVTAMLGATPVFADIDESTFNIAPASAAAAVATARRMGLKPQAIIPVDLFGLPADHDAIAAVAAAENLIRTRRRRSGIRRDLSRTTARFDRGGDGDKLFPREAARLLRRWRGRIHRR